MPEIQLGDGFTINANVATRRTSLYGQPDIGKTNSLTVICEGLLRIGVPVTEMDWKGDLWGQRSSADGTKPGFPVVIFGGDHADVAIQETDGKEIGHVVARESMPSIIDLSGFEHDAQRRRFATAFLRSFLNAKAPEQFRTPHLLAIDEAQQFAPQNPYGEGVQLLAATLAVTGLGRKRGIGMLTTALRAAQLNKNLVELADLYLFMQVAGRNDLKAISETLQRFDPEEAKELVKRLPRLQKGEVIAYSPSWLGIMEQHRFRLRETFDSSATPEVGAAVVAGPKSFASVDTPALSLRIAATREAREAEDPVALRARIVELEKRVGERGDLNAIKTHQDARDAMQRRAEAAEHDMEAAFADRNTARAQRDKLAGVIESLASVLRLVQTTSTAALDGLALEAKEISDGIAPSETAQGGARDSASSESSGIKRAAPGTRVASVVASGATALPSVPRSSANGEKITPACMRILAGLAQRHPHPVTKTQLGLLADQSPKSSSFANNIYWLNARSYVVRSSGMIGLSESGRKLVGDVKPVKSSADLIAIFRSRLAPAKQRILDALVDAYPKGLDKERLATLSGQSATSSSYANNLYSLNALELIERVADGLRARDSLFPTGKPR